jgi:hypothetical protein
MPQKEELRETEADFGIKDAIGCVYTHPAVGQSDSGR